MFKTLQKPGEFILTLAGSYHSGFSTGINIGEAVNIATQSWLQYGEKCQAIYRKSKEKIPVFPMDWLIIKNIQHLKEIKLDHESKVALLKHYEKFYKEEKKWRNQMENSLRD